MKKYRKIDPLDICDVLTKIENSFNIKLDNESLAGATTYGKLYDIILDKIKLEHSDTCTTQHAFYLLRNAIAATTNADKCGITPHSKLSKIFPKEHRPTAIEEIERELGFKINLLQPRKWLIDLFGIVGFIFFCMIFQNWLIGATGVLASILGFKLAGKFGKEMRLKTVGDLANKISRESYLKVRRDNTVNRNEVEQKVKELFMDDTRLDPVFLLRK
ncbi:MAG TPA: hypothetical protein VHS53_11490 [Mucilaginibacter sp.]|nr:hypothetical protein [Mucilaginibacter sp.]